MTRTLIVDDEPLARRELQRLLRAHPDVNVVGEAATIDDAELRISELSPDLLLLDIQMPGGTGFDLLERLLDPPRVIFTTAYDEHAVHAFEVNALDYLLKPVDPRRLAGALSRLGGLKGAAPDSALAPRQGASSPGPRSDTLERLFVRDGERCWFVPLAEVRLLESEGNYTRLFWKDERPFLGRSLVALEQRLPPSRFFRANRRHIIALDFVAKVEMGAAGRLDVTLRGGPTVEVSRRQARLFRQAMNV